MVSASSLPFCAVLILLSGFAGFVRADVGVYSPDDMTVNRRDFLSSGMWSLGPEGCRLGKPGNLVVTPRPGSTPEGGEILDPFYSGPQLCTWLSMLERAHDAVRPAWESEHRRRRKNVSSWNLYRRFKLWRNTFPEFLVDVRVTHLSLWNKDRFGHPLPWAKVLFGYSCPDEETGYGMFNHLCGTVFSQGADPRSPTEIHLLLQPRVGFNRPLDVSASNWQFVSGAISGLAAANEEAEEEYGTAGGLIRSMVVRSSAFATLRGTVNDCWMYRGRCYFRW